MGILLGDKAEGMLIKGLLFVGGGVGLYFVGKKFLKDGKQNTEEKTLGTDVNTQAASALKAAFNPSGQSMLQWTDGTSTETVMKIAAGITDFGKVAEAYKNLYRSNISDDMTQELSSAELEKFYAIIKNNSAVKQKNEATTKAHTALNTLFKFKIGSQVGTNPRKGFTKVAYYKDHSSGTVTTALSSDKRLVIQYWHTNPGGFAGYVVNRQQIVMKNEFGKYVTKPMYKLKGIPLRGIDKNAAFWMFEDELKQINN